MDLAVLATVLKKHTSITVSKASHTWGSTYSNTPWTPSQSVFRGEFVCRFNVIYCIGLLSSLPAVFYNRLIGMPTVRWWPGALSIPNPAVTVGACLLSRRELVPAHQPPRLSPPNVFTLTTLHRRRNALPSATNQSFVTRESCFFYPEKSTWVSVLLLLKLEAKCQGLAAAKCCSGDCHFSERCQNLSSLSVSLRPGCCWVGLRACERL